MTSLTVFLKTYWWLILLGMMALCFLSRKDSGICCGLGAEHPTGTSTLEILDRRYASGEIGPIEYEEKILTLGLRNRR